MNDFYELRRNGEFVACGKFVNIYEAIIQIRYNLLLKDMKKEGLFK